MKLHEIHYNLLGEASTQKVTELIHRIESLQSSGNMGAFTSFTGKDINLLMRAIRQPASIDDADYDDLLELHSELLRQGSVFTQDNVNAALQLINQGQGVGQIAMALGISPQDAELIIDRIAEIQAGQEPAEEIEEGEQDHAARAVTAYLEEHPEGAPVKKIAMAVEVLGVQPDEVTETLRQFLDDGTIDSVTVRGQVRYRLI